MTPAIGTDTVYSSMKFRTFYTTRWVMVYGGGTGIPTLPVFTIRREVYRSRRETPTCHPTWLPACSSTGHRTSFTLERMQAFLYGTVAQTPAKFTTHRIQS